VPRPRWRGKRGESVESELRSGGVEVGWRRHGRVDFGGVEQRDEADEGPLEEWRRIMVGALRGSVVIDLGSRRSGPSQLIPGVRRTWLDCQRRNGYGMHGLVNDSADKPAELTTSGVCWPNGGANAGSDRPGRPALAWQRGSVLLARCASRPAQRVAPIASRGCPRAAQQRTRLAARLQRRIAGRKRRRTRG